MEIRDIELISESDGSSAFPPLELVSESDGSYKYGTPKVATLYYPANRMDLQEQLVTPYGEMVDSMYKDNTIFTAYDIKSRRHSDLTGSLTGVFSGRGDNYGINSQTVANIMMPRSNTDVDEHSHEFVTSEASLMSRGSGTVGSAVGSGLATMVADVFDNITKGFFADHGEAIGTPTRATYKGANHRTKTYSWRLTPRNATDLLTLLSIIRIFAYTSYGKSSNSREVETNINTLIDAITDHYKQGGRYNLDNVNLTSTAVLESFKYVKVMSNPTIWYIRNYNHSSFGMSDTSVFGPANIVNMKINKTPDGYFQGLAKMPNISSTYDLEITFREALSHTRDTIGWSL